MREEDTEGGRGEEEEEKDRGGYRNQEIKIEHDLKAAVRVECLLICWVFCFVFAFAQAIKKVAAAKKALRTESLVRAVGWKK